MSEILIGYVKIDSPVSIDICMSELLCCAKKEGIGIWFNSDVHKEEIVDEYRGKKDYLIFSITDSFKFENVHRILWSDLCREEQDCSLEEDVARIVALLRIMLRYTSRIDLFLGNYGCFLREYRTKINVRLDDFGNVLSNLINHDDVRLKHFTIN